MDNKWIYFFFFSQINPSYEVDFCLSSNFAIKWILCFTKWIPFLFQMTFNICNTWNLYVQVKSGFLQWSEVETCYGFSVI